MSKEYEFDEESYIIIEHSFHKWNKKENSNESLKEMQSNNWKQKHSSEQAYQPTNLKSMILQGKN